MNRIISSLIFLLVSSFSFAQDAGIDDRINEAFTPIANWWGAFVLHNFPGTSIPTIIFLLVGGNGMKFHSFWCFVAGLTARSFWNLVRDEQVCTIRLSSRAFIQSQTSCGGSFELRKSDASSA